VHGILAPRTTSALTPDSVAVAVQPVRIASVHAHRTVDVARSVPGATSAKSCGRFGSAASARDGSSTILFEWLALRLRLC
jgi:hypothetical protein